jgi:protease I
MAAKEKETAEPQLDDDGIVILEFQHTVLVIVSPDNFGEQGVCMARSMLLGIRVATIVASSRYDEVLKGRAQEFFLADEDLDGLDLTKYAGVLIASSDDDSLANDERVVRIVREMNDAKKPIASIGNGLDVLLRAGVVKGKRVTGDAELAPAAKRAGAKLSGRQVEAAGNIVTALSDDAGVRFGRAFVDALVASFDLAAPGT